MGERGEQSTPDEQPGFREAMTALIGERWTMVWTAAPAALAGEDEEGVHDVRVATRRLRAAMDVAAPAFPSRWYRELHAEAKEMTGALGEARDRDVLLLAFRKERENAAEPERAGIDRLIARVERERTDARAAMEAYLHDVFARGVPAATERRFGADASALNDTPADAPGDEDAAR